MNFDTPLGGGPGARRTPPDPWLKGDWFSQTLTLEYQSWFQNVPFKMQPAPLPLGDEQAHNMVGLCTLESS
jgi:hypothetical protein